MQSKGNEKEEGMGFSNGLSNKFEDVSRYADIIGREHPVSKRHLFLWVLQTPGLFHLQIF